VQAYRKHGWAVVANSRSIPASDDAGGVTVAGDIADPVVARNVIDTAVRDFGRVDALVNNAGIFLAKPSSSPSKACESMRSPPASSRPRCTHHRHTTASPGYTQWDGMGTISDIVDGVLYLKNGPMLEPSRIGGGRAGPAGR
jgi:NAD(P)-dependent dehydrogenase (short-subunit alcohol dehydrogenase family)